MSFEQFSIEGRTALITGAAHRLGAALAEGLAANGVYVVLHYNTRKGPAEALAQRLQSLFQNSAYSDNIVLIQAYVPGPEYRVVATQDQLLLAYGKEGETSGQQDLNPLHQEDGRAVRIAEGALLDSMRSLVAQIAPAVELGFYAVDLIDSSEGLRILELNPNPFCYFYNRDNGREDFSAIYRQLLEKYVL